MLFVSTALRVQQYLSKAERITCHLAMSKLNSVYTQLKDFSLANISIELPLRRCKHLRRIPAKIYINTFIFTIHNNVSGIHIGISSCTVLYTQSLNLSNQTIHSRLSSKTAESVSRTSPVRQCIDKAPSEDRFTSGSLLITNSVLADFGHQACLKPQSQFEARLFLELVHWIPRSM